MDTESKIALVKKSPTEEIISEEELRALFETKAHPQHYIGYEVSGKLHLGSLMMCGYKINDFIKTGIGCRAYFAHWHSLINKKLGGDWEKIKAASLYYEEAFKTFCPGLKIVQATDLYNNNSDYWFKVIQIASNLTEKRNLRCMPILGRSEKDSCTTAQSFYPSMQAADIKEMDLDIAHSGMDQRSVHVMAREVFPKLGWKKPILIHHHLIPGLAEPQLVPGATKEEQVLSSKMSKSKPWTCIFIHDTEKEIQEKISKAWCLPKVFEGNPIAEFVKYLIFHEKSTFTIERPAKFGGNIVFNSIEEFENAYKKGEIHPMDLKNSVSRELNEMIKPIREHFEKPKYAELLKVYDDAQITR